MARRKSETKKPEMVKAYRVVRNSCFHAGVEYKVGDRLPDLPLAALNVHLPNLELVEVEEILVDDDTPPEVAIADVEPETVVEVITQVESEGGTDYDVLL